MPHVVTQPTPPFASSSGSFEVHQIPAAEDNLVWLLVCKATGDAAVVDGPDAEGVLAYTQARGLRLRMVLNTHTHGDHVGVNRDLERRGLLSSLEVVGPGAVAARVPGLTRAVTGGDSVRLGALTGQVIQTDGHVLGHVAYLFEDVLFSGDCLFAGGCGRVFSGDFAAMFEGLDRLRALDGSTRVCCAHEYTEDNLRFARYVDPHNAALRVRAESVRARRRDGHSTVPSTLEEERATNPMLRWDAPSLMERLAELGAGSLQDGLAVFTSTRKLKDSGTYRSA